MSAYLLVSKQEWGKKNLHFFNSHLVALYFAHDRSLFGIFHPSSKTQLIASIFAEFGEIAS